MGMRECVLRKQRGESVNLRPVTLGPAPSSGAPTGVMVPAAIAAGRMLDGASRPFKAGSLQPLI